MAKGNFGNLNKQEFTDLKAELTSFQDGITQAQKAFNGLVKDTDLSGLADNTRQAANAARDLAKATQEDLTSQTGRNKLMEKYNAIKREQNGIESKILVIKRQIELANKDELASLQAALKGALDFADQLDGAAKAAEQVATQVDKVAEAGKGFEKISKVLGKIPLIGAQIAPAFDKASAAAKKAASEGAGPFEARMKGTLALSKSIAFTIGAGIVNALIQASKRLGELNKQLGLGIDAARGVAERFEEFATNSEDARITTDKLIAANGQLNQALGTTVEFSGKTLENFILTTEYMGVSVESAAKLETLARTTGESTAGFAGNLAESVSQAGKNNNLFIATGAALEKVKNLSATTLLNLRRNPEAIGEAIVATEKLGVSFDQLRGIASSLLDFESSIQKELEAEILTGRELNLERARAAALRGDDLALTKELANQVGTLAEFEQMNVIQRESLANAFGLSSDAMSEMLLKQELLNSLGEEAKDLSAEQARQIKQMVKDGDAINEGDALLQLQQQQDAAKKFQDAVGKLKSAFVDFFEDFEPKLEKLVDAIKSMTESRILKTVVGFATSGVGIASLAGMMLASRLRGTPMLPMFVTMMGVGGAAGRGGMMMGGLYRRGSMQNAAGQNLVRSASSPTGYRVASGYGRGVSGTYANVASRTRGGLTAGGYGMLGGMAATMVGGAMQNSESEGMQTAGAFVSGAGTGVMMGSMFGVPGMVVGGLLGGIYGAVTDWKEKQEAREAKEAELREQAKAGEKDAYMMMEEHLRAIAEKELKLSIDGNEMNTQLQVSKSQLGSS